MNKLVTHIKCKCGFDNEILFLFEEGFKCMVCGLHIKKTEELKQHARKVLKVLLDDEVKLLDKYDDKHQGQIDLDSYKKMLKELDYDAQTMPQL